MRFSAVIFAALFSIVASKPVDIFDPPVTSPDSSSVWTVGSVQTVTWDTSNPPAQITDPEGTIFLSKAGLINLDQPLAAGFPITAGSVQVTVPSVAPGTDYAVVLFGDSGNASPEFTISA